jgi:nitronate monooxygenase
MKAWPDRRIQDLFGIESPIILAPMAGPGTAALAIAVSEGGGLGSLPCAQLSGTEIRTALETISGSTTQPINVNFFAHTPAISEPERERAWRVLLKPYYLELGLDPEAPLAPPSRPPSLSIPNRVPSSRSSDQKSSAFISACPRRICSTASRQPRRA